MRNTRQGEIHTGLKGRRHVNVKMEDAMPCALDHHPPTFNQFPPDVTPSRNLT
jgi:hypothetical protein